MRASDAGLDGVDAPFPLELPGDGRHQRFIAVVADAHRHPPTEIDTLDLLEKPVHEVLARLLAVRHDVDASVLLLL
jgi:hypothetical protein